MNRNLYNVHAGGMGTTSYRGQTSIAPVAPYAFTSPPALTSPGNPLRQHPTTPHLRTENRTLSAPAIPHTQQSVHGTMPNRPGHRHTVTSPSLPLVSASTTSPLGQQAASQDDSVIASPKVVQNASRPLSMIEMNVPDFSSVSLNSQPPAKPSPDRYRRANRKPESPGTLVSGSALPSGSGMATVGHLYSPTVNSTNSSAQIYRPLTTQESIAARGTPNTSSRDDMAISHRSGSSDLAKRYRRRSVSSIEITENPEPVKELIENPASFRQVKTYASVVAGPYKPEPPKLLSPSQSNSSHGRKGSDDSAGSSRTSSRPSSVSCIPSTMSKVAQRP